MQINLLSIFKGKCIRYMFKETFMSALASTFMFMKRTLVRSI